MVILAMALILATPINVKVARPTITGLLSGLSSYKVANALMLKVCWLCCVLGGLVFGLPALSAMVLISIWQKQFAEDLPFMLGLGLIGLCLDTLWMYVGVLDYGSAAVQLSPGMSLAPAWIIMLWLAVGLSIRHSLIFLVNRPLFGALLVGGGSPLSYLTGQSFGAVVIPSTQGLVVLAVAWFGLFYLVFHLAKTRLTAQ